MLGFLQLCSDSYTIIDLVGKVAELAEKYPFVVARWSVPYVEERLALKDYVLIFILNTMY